MLPSLALSRTWPVDPSRRGRTLSPSSFRTLSDPIVATLRPYLASSHRLSATPPCLGLSVSLTRLQNLCISRLAAALSLRAHIHTHTHTALLSLAYTHSALHSTPGSKPLPAQTLTPRFSLRHSHHDTTMRTECFWRENKKSQERQPGALRRWSRGFCCSSGMRSTACGT